MDAFDGAGPFMTAKEFTDKYMPLAEPLYRVAYYILDDRQEAEDAVQDLYMKLWSRRDGLDGVDAPRAYCISMMRNLCIDRLRRSLGSGAAAADCSGEHVSMSSECGAAVRSVVENYAPGEDVEESLLVREELKQTARAIETLPETERKVLEMRAFEGLSYEEIAARTALTQPSLRVILSRARKRLRETRKT